MAAGVPLPARIAWREARGGLGALKLLAVCLFLGVLALAAIGSLTAAIDRSLLDQGREILGGDIEIRLSGRPPTDAERHIWQQTAGAATTSETVRMRAMVRTDVRTNTKGRTQTETAEDAAVLAELKAVDRHWPLYGEAQLQDGGGNSAVQQALTRGAVISEALAQRLQLQTGDQIAVGLATLPVTAILTSEPDRAGDGFALGPGFLLSDAQLAATGLVQPGSLYTSHVRLRLPPGSDVAGVAHRLESAEGGWQVTDSSGAAPGLRRFVDRLGQILLLVGLSALAVAGIGIGNGVSAYLAGRTASLAILKTLGATRRQLVMASLLLVLGVALAAALAGALAGALLPPLIARLAGDLLPVAPAAGFYPAPLVAAIGFGLLVTLAFAIWPVGRAAALPVATILRGDAGQPSAQAARQARRWLSPALAAGALAIGLALWQAGQPRFTLVFFAGLAAVLALLWLLGTGLIRLSRTLPASPNLLWRMAIASLGRPGAQTRALLVALGLGLTLFSTLAFVQSTFDGALRASVPEQAPAYFLLDLPRDDRAHFLSLLPPGSEVRMVPSLRGPVTRVNGVPAAAIGPLPDGAYVLQGDRGLTFAAELPPGNRIVAGSWWPADPAGQAAGGPLVSMDAEQASYLGLTVGDSISVSVLGVEITATIASLREINWDSFGFNFVLVYDPATLQDAPYSWMATVTPPAGTMADFAATMSRAFPTVTVIRTGDVLDDIGRILGQIGLAVRLAASAAILAGIAVLVGALAAQARRRRSEAVILKLLGATRRQLMLATLAEHALLGLVVAVLAYGLGGLAGWLLVTQLMDFPWAPDWVLAAAVVAAGALLISLLGLAGSWRMLGASIRDVWRDQ